MARRIESFLRGWRCAGATAFCFVVFAACPVRAEFLMGTIAPSEPIETIKVTLSVGRSGEALAEAVDLHLGLGFPLRLYPLGGDSREPAFAAFPDSSTLADGVHALAPGESATFEFSAAESDMNDADVLRSSRELLRDLTVGDVQKIGFASLGQSAWVLNGYAIEINGKPFASHTAMRGQPRQNQLALQAALQQAVADLGFAAQQAADLENLVASGLATEDERDELAKHQGEVARLAANINTFSARVAGALPWFTETNRDFEPAPLANAVAEPLEITLTTRDGDDSGSRNPLYLWANGRKYALTSEDDPLLGRAAEQSFSISAAELRANPLPTKRMAFSTRGDDGQESVYEADVVRVGLGMVASDLPAATVPDRARVDRLVVTSGDRLIFDSESADFERQSLQAVRFTPPAHRDANGQILVDGGLPREVTHWLSGTLAGADLLAQAEPPAETLPPVAPPAAPGNAAFGPFGASPFGGLGSAFGPRLPFLPARLNAPRRRRPAGAGGNQPLALNIVLPTLGTPSAANAPTPPVTPTPAPAAPVLSNIRVNPSIAILRDGDQATVQWQVSGNAANVASYRVDLFGVLPHKNPPLLNTPLATQSNITPKTSATGGGSQSLTARPPAIQVSNIQSQLTGAEASYLFVQPKVTALSSNGTALVSSFGSILPLFPAQCPIPYPAALLPGQLVANGQPVNRALVPPPSFQVMPAGAPPLPWRSCPSADPQSSSTAWPLWAEQDSHFALTFASYLGLNVLPAYNAAVRPANNGERIGLQYENAVLLPANLPTAAKGWRLVAHVGFLGGTATNATALVQTRVNLFVRPADVTPFFTMQTPQPLAFTKLSSNGAPAPCLLIDMPIRFDLMAGNNLAASPHDASKYAITSFVRGNQGYRLLGRTAAGPLVAMTVNFMIAQQSTNTADAVCLFGLRVVPDN